MYKMYRRQATNETREGRAERLCSHDNLCYMPSYTGVDKIMCHHKLPTTTVYQEILVAIKFGKMATNCLDKY